ncbi:MULTISPECIES: dipeptidase [Pseudoalteromonas]|uniref:Membrane dipeptidase n=1 Tax=Pseudoalteromonas ruthenica TaxID=151081 RepID=A0A0F4PP12_9GAMM|nr:MULTISPECIES: dipeptidase [Pseudoalteromonas]KJY95986.1 peptidase M19 [Pseudoalteromonas ruthenica]KJY96889.1 peptidase M19 [Pseudoalteromonas ruthenica]MCF2864030.1 dipeptidase [Pseudoalteromonas sp. CNAT2-18]MCG7559924.1 dipeptidase [Pseudoalteromonas sp. CNAT2-18.1]MCG7568229.1 dipeptidase [Pseudoalteromonas sp. CnMc7-15]|tara:strand:- start:327 stop:1520 length:1194 start_codon:yes stop_codon:yes gene_type:complete
MKLSTLGAALAIALGSTSVAAQDDYQASEKAIQLAKDNILIDTHIDVPYRIHNKWDDVSKATERGDFDYPRAIEGGLNAPFMSIYIPAHLEFEGKGKSYELANQLIDMMEALAYRAPDKFAIADSVADVEQQFKNGVMSLAMGMENGSPIEGELKNLHHFYERGVRYITLAHSQSNHISDSSYDIRRKWKGLSPFGKELVQEMNNVGMLIDVSHISDDAFYQVMDISNVPVIASHSSLRKYTPGFERNMDDDMLLALKKNGGVIQINFGSSFVTNQANTWYDRRDEAQQQAKQSGKDTTDFKAAFRKKNPFPYASLEQVLDHIDHVVELIGIEHVGIGSDYDGVGDSLPVGLKDVSTYPNLVQGLLDRGYSDADIKKILGENLLRVWRQAESYAKAH